MVIALLVDPALSDWPADTPTEATVPAMGLVSRASASDCWLLTSVAEAESIAAWSVASWTALLITGCVGLELDDFPPAAPELLLVPDPPEPPEDPLEDLPVLPDELPGVEDPVLPVLPGVEVGVGADDAAAERSLARAASAVDTAF